MTVERYLMEAQKGPAVYVEDVFSTYLYTGTGSDQVLTTGIDLSTKGGLVWSKRRSNVAESHFLQDTLRGLTARLSTNLTNAQTSSGAWPMNALSTTGMTVSGVSYAAGGETYVSWTFRKQPKFFDIVTYTGDGTNNRQIVHALGATPGMVIVKCTSSAAAWPVWHRSLSGSNYNLYLNTTISSGAQGDFSSNGSVSFSSTTFPVSNGGLANSAGQTYVAYLFADQAGGFGLSGSDSVVACGSFTANSLGTFPAVNLGWEPQWLLVKNSSNAGYPWAIYDNMRGLSNTNQAELLANTSGAEYSYSGSYLVPNATGFSNPTTGLFPQGTYIYLAIRRGPMKVPTSGTSVYSPVVQSGTVAAGGLAYNFGFPPDAVIEGVQGGAGFSPTSTSRLTGNYQFMITASTAAESSDGGYRQYTTSMFGITYGISLNFGSYGGIVGWGFRRAPGYMDEVCYTGTGSATTVAHNLGVAPELMIVKRRNIADFWAVYSAPRGNTEYLALNATAASSTSGANTIWNNTTPQSSVFTVGTDTAVNGSGSTYVAYLFATCPGVSKVGSYTGTGAAQNINCGFSAGARFILIKRTDSTGDWYVYDSARGISSGNDPYLNMNTTAGQVTGTNYVDTYASGFTLTATAPAALNANGGSYIFLAIA